MCLGTAQAAVHPQVTAQSFLGMVVFSLGYPEQGLARMRAAISEARRLAHPATLASALGQGAKLLPFDGDNAVLDEWVDEMVAITTDQGLPHWRAGTTIYQGWAKVKRHNISEGISLLRSGLNAFRAIGAEMWMPQFIAFLATAHQIAGEVEEALGLLDDALQVVERTGERWFAAELNRLKGELLLGRGDTAVAEELYRTAVRIAQEQEAKLWELRAATSLARLHCDQGRRSEAGDLLAAVYGWFTEGFDTLDLKAAKALLDELS